MHLLIVFLSVGWGESQRRDRNFLRLLVFHCNPEYVEPIGFAAKMANCFFVILRIFR